MSPIDVVYHAYREMFKLTEEQFDKVVMACSDEELEALMLDKQSRFCDKRKALLIVKKYL